jgi:hypothetical protein
MQKFDIPDFLKHLPIDSRGYPIPFFVTMVKGKPDFRLLDGKKQRRAFFNNLCGICGKELFAIAYSISGPLGLRNAVSQDPLMHLECAQFSLKVCPHLHFEKADRRETGDLYKKVMNDKEQDFLVKEKPKELYLVTAMNWVILDLGSSFLYKFDVKGYEKYHYENGTLVKA